MKFLKYFDRHFQFFMTDYNYFKWNFPTWGFFYSITFHEVKNVIENYLKLHSRNYKEIGQISPREEFKREKTSILTVKNRQIR